jgi:hypothetical protein
MGVDRTRGGFRRGNVTVGEIIQVIDSAMHVAGSTIYIIRLCCLMLINDELAKAEELDLPVFKSTYT